MAIHSARTPADGDEYASSGLNTVSRELATAALVSDDNDWSKVAAKAVALRILGHTQAEIAKELCVTARNVERWLIDARERAELLEVGPLLDQVALPLALDNLIDGLREGDQKYTLATLSGRGAFSAHSKSQATIQETRLEIQVVRAAGTDDVPMQSQIVGVPREVLDAVQK
jgi:hypothetical protein